MSYEQCFGFVPLLELGGQKNILNIDKVNILEHLNLTERPSSSLNTSTDCW
ncbi:T6SS immunity protein Tdi1 domain-containing protein [Streptococcus parasuis]|uniref:T6SS immunity protein Tdi1 domain-containing protein n=1 Tax=Streptococcus parasuis TaxID=1501662 RepID=UPI002412D119|nr:T6SS immunity protein Tdi1 domain-containing protein [Streptococcus parasuis]